MPATLLLLHALSPLHMGTGAAIGAIDLPHAREKATGFPYIPGSGIKGVLRDEFEACGEDTKKLTGHLFGAPHKEQIRDQGALLFSDASLLALPVRSWLGGFAWVTCPSLLLRLSRELLALGQPALDVPRLENGEQARAGKDCVLAHQGKVLMHDLQVQLQAPLAETLVTRLAQLAFATDSDWKAELSRRLLVVHEDAMRYFCTVALDVRPRVSLGEGKQAKDGALWNEENLPTESLLWSTVAADKIKGTPASDALGQFTDTAGSFDRVQLGGKASVGRGIVRLTLPLAKVPA